MNEFRVVTKSAHRTLCSELMNQVEKDEFLSDLLKDHTFKTVILIDHDNITVTITQNVKSYGDEPA